ncbi:hypothetical protein [Xanthomonas campestris]|uniref:hypothetical protein n=2 Tax=Xanthomonas campestris TaxID=339 RepID=UPI002B38869D|nr:hypothetical protein [Xanthomonas campestris pv. raphani]
MYQPCRNGRSATVMWELVVHHCITGQVRQQHGGIAGIAGGKKAGNGVGQGKRHGSDFRCETCMP